MGGAALNHCHHHLLLVTKRAKKNQPQQKLE